MIKSLIYCLVIFFLHPYNIYGLSIKTFAFNNQQSSKNRRSVFDLGNVLSDTTINLQLNLKVGVADLAAAKIQLIKSSDNTIINTFSCSGITCTQDYYVDSSSGTQMSIRIYAPDSSSFPPNIQIFNLYIRSYRGPITDPPSGLRSLIRATDVLRQEIVKIIYASATRTFHFTIYPIPTVLSNPEEAIRLFKVDPQSGWQTGYSNSVSLTDDGFTIVQPGVGADVLGLYSYSAILQKGFYAMVVTYNVANPSMKVTWQTDSYNCTFSSMFPDVNAIFTGCIDPSSTPPSDSDITSPVQASKDLCLQFSTTSSTCQKCIGGYFVGTNGVCLQNSLCPAGRFIQNGKCIINNPLCRRQGSNSSICLQCISGFFASKDGQCLLKLKCPDRQYFSQGSCKEVSSLCDNYSEEGLCTNCIDPSNYYFQQGICIKRLLTCGYRQYISNNTCVNVSDSCGYYNPNNGACLSCAKDTEEDLINGTCKKIDLNCSLNEYQSGKECILIPQECFRFDKIDKICLECYGGFTLSGQRCVKIICKDGYFYSTSSQGCIQISQLCLIYDKATGTCKTCKNSNYIINSQGKCVQVINSLASCKARQQLGYGQCISPKQNCKIYNLDLQICDQCYSSFQFDYAGHCSLKVNCSQNEFSVNGLCLRSPDNCQKVDSIGLCIKCVSDQYRIVLGQCVLFKKCTNRQYLSLERQCIDVDPLCNFFNPSNGDCFTCIQPKTTPNLGKCCPSGQLYNGKICSPVTTQPSKSNDPTACLLYHSSLYTCLKCNPGYISDFSTKGICVKE